MQIKLAPIISLRQTTIPALLNCIVRVNQQHCLDMVVVTLCPDKQRTSVSKTLITRPVFLLNSVSQSYLTKLQQGQIFWQPSSPFLISICKLRLPLHIEKNICYVRTCKIVLLVENKQNTNFSIIKIFGRKVLTRDELDVQETESFSDNSKVFFYF